MGEWFWNGGVDTALRTMIYINIYIYIYIYFIYIYIYLYIYKSHSGQLSIATSNNPSVVNFICIRSFRYTHVITSRKFQIKTNVVTDEGNSQNEIRNWTNDEIGVAAQSWFWVRVELSVHGLKSYSSQLSIATSNNPSVVNTILIYIHIYLYTYTHTYIHI